MHSLHNSVVFVLYLKVNIKKTQIRDYGEGNDKDKDLETLFSDSTLGISQGWNFYICNQLNRCNAVPL